MKIAICISGETRGFNWESDDNSHLPEGYELQNFINLVKEQYPGVDCHIYAHTWDHCKLPNKDLFDYRKLEVTSQQEIVDWVSDRFCRRAYQNRMEFDKRVTLTELGPEAYVNTLLEVSKNKYAQQWGAFKAYNLLQDVRDQYDLVIRWRWDNGIPENNMHMMPKFWEAWETILQEANSDNGFTLFQSMTFYTFVTPGILAPEDIFFVHNEEASHILRKIDFPNMMDNIIYQQLGPEKYADHTLWGMIFEHANIGHGYFNMPPCVQLARVGPYLKDASFTY